MGQDISCQVTLQILQLFLAGSNSKDYEETNAGQQCNKFID